MIISISDLQDQALLNVPDTENFSDKMKNISRNIVLPSITDANRAEFLFEKSIKD